MGGSTAPCTAEPTNVIETLDETKLSGVGSTYSMKQQGGFSTSGREISGSFLLEEKSTTGIAAFTNTVYAAGEIHADAWSINRMTGAGEVGLGPDSEMMSYYSLINTSGFLIETGPVVEQSFVGGSAIDSSKSQLFIGGGQYSQHFDETAKTTLTLTPEASGDYSFEAMGFGFAGFDASSSDPAYGYFSPLGYSHQPQAAVLASNFVGLGMPEYLWLQLTNLLYKVDSTFD